MTAIAFHPCSLEEDQLGFLLDALANTGFAGIEGIPLLFDTYRDRTELLFEQFRPRKISLVALTGGGDWIIPEQRKELVEQHRPLVEFLRTLKAQYLILETGPRTIYEGTRRDFKNAAEALNDLGKLCLDHDLYACIQPRRGQRVESEEEIDRIMNEVDTGVISLCPDTGELLLAEIDPARIVKIYGSCIRHIHCSDLSHIEELEEQRERDKDAEEDYIPVGKGRVDFTAVAEALRSVNYGGWISARMKFCEEEFSEELRTSMDFLKTIFSSENET